MNELELGVAIANARRRAGLTQQQLCALTEMSYSTLAKIERGAIKSPSVFTVTAIASALKIDLADLINSTKPHVKSIEFIYFDVNGVLVHFYQRAFLHIAKDHGVGADQVEQAFWRHNDAACRGEITMREFNQMLSKTLQIKTIDFNDYYIDSIKPVSQIIDLLHKCQNDYKIGLLTNIMPGVLSKLVSAGMVPNLKYDAIVDSSKVHAVKPESKIFAIAEDMANVAPNKILFIDDSRINVMSAANRGWQVVWFDDMQITSGINSIKQHLK